MTSSIFLRTRLKETNNRRTASTGIRITSAADLTRHNEVALRPVIGLDLSNKTPSSVNRQNSLLVSRSINQLKTPLQNDEELD